MGGESHFCQRALNWPSLPSKNIRGSCSLIHHFFNQRKQINVCWLFARLRDIREGFSGSNHFVSFPSAELGTRNVTV